MPIPRELRTARAEQQSTWMGMSRKPLSDNMSTVMWSYRPGLRPTRLATASAACAARVALAAASEVRGFTLGRVCLGAAEAPEKLPLAPRRLLPRGTVLHSASPSLSSSSSSSSSSASASPAHTASCIRHLSSENAKQGRKLVSSKKHTYTLQDLIQLQGSSNEDNR